MKTLVPTAQEHNQLKEYARNAVAAGFYSGIQNPHQAMMIILTGLELNMGPVWALQNVHIIKGKPSLKAEGMLGLVYKNIEGARVNFIKRDSNICEIEASRPGSKSARFVFTMDDARTAGLTNKENWQKYPKSMLHARCISDMCRAMFPDALMGVSYTPQEIQDFDNSDEPRNVREEIAPSLEHELPSLEEAKQLQDKDIIPELSVELPLKEEVSYQTDVEPSIDAPLAAEKDDSIGSHVLKCKKFNGTKIKDAKSSELASYVKYWRGREKPPTGQLEFEIKLMEQYLSSNGMIPPVMDHQEEIPW